MKNYMQQYAPPHKQYTIICKKIKNIKNIKNMHFKMRLTAAVSPLSRFALFRFFIYMQNMHDMQNMQQYASHDLACVAQLGTQVWQWTYSVAVQQSD